MTENSGFVARLRAESSIHDVVENRTNALIAADLIESLLDERDAARRLLTRVSLHAYADVAKKALRDAATDARIRGDIGHPEGVPAEDWLERRASNILSSDYAPVPEDDFGDASISRAMAAWQASGRPEPENKSRLEGNNNT